MENYIKGLIYAHKEELTNIGIGTPHERSVRDNLISRIKELETILECGEEPKVTVIKGGPLYGR
ncbi:hypothetical protein [Clostridium sp.]|uniref:hypothetical protein n=1 Tax=Clostridium sp. TaxID=1506 RepID=UPI0032175CFD